MIHGKRDLGACLLVAAAVLMSGAGCSDKSGAADLGPDIFTQHDLDTTEGGARPDLTPDVDVSKAPTITSILPDSGHAAATTPVLLSGDNFETGAKV